MSKRGALKAKIHSDVLKVIEFVKKYNEAFGINASDLYVDGNCGNFHRILRTIFPEAKPYMVFTFKFVGGFVPAHVHTKIAGKYFDIGGMQKKGRWNVGKHTLKGPVQRIEPKDDYAISDFSNNFKGKLKDSYNSDASSRELSQKHHVETLVKTIEFAQKGFSI